MNMKQVAELIGISYETAKRHGYYDLIPYYSKGGTRHYEARDVYAFIETLKVNPSCEKKLTYTHQKAKAPTGNIVSQKAVSAYAKALGREVSLKLSGSQKNTTTNMEVIA